LLLFASTRHYNLCACLSPTWLRPSLSRYQVLKKMLPTMVHKMMPIFFFISILMVLSCLVFDKRFCL
jgi:hypothetical protein